MKQILIICDLFPPAFGPRMGYLCKYLSQYGWEPTVITEAVNDEHAFSILQGSTDTTYVDFYPAKGKKMRRLQWFLTFLADMLFGYKDYCMYRKAKLILREKKFDAILCSTFRTFPLKAARMVARKHKLPLIVDLRDIIEQYTGNEFIAHQLPQMGGLEKSFTEWFRNKSLHIRNRILYKSSYVTTISPWHVETLKRYNSKIELIYNGYDPELFYPEVIPTHHFTITYTGRILSTAMRDPSLFLEALSLLIKDGSIHPTDCRVNWYTDEESREIISEEAEKFNLLSYMNFKGFVPAVKIPQILNSSSVLLILTNKAAGRGPKGVMTTKFFESLAVEKPILCVRSDESYLAEAIEKSNAGLAATQVQEVYDFLKHYYTEWKNKGYTTSSIDRNILHSYSRKEQAGQFANIFNQLTAHV